MAHDVHCRLLIPHLGSCFLTQRQKGLTMRKFGAVLTMVGGLAMASATPAMANGFKSYRLCGGNTFSTCAAVEINVVGNNVTMRVWNLSQNMGATYGQANGSLGGSILDGISLFNLPAGVQVTTSSLLVSGPGANANHGWSLKNYGNAGAFAVDGRNGANHSLTAGIASGCAPGGQPSSSANLLVNPCSSMNGTGDWVTFSFQISGGAWNPNATDLSVRSYNEMTGETSEFWTGMAPGGQLGTATTVTPEPVTMTLLATGLAGMSGAGFLRRRRQKSSQV